jgi:prepilin-type N-terminal cleavage/methylation domain-containing protein
MIKEWARKQVGFTIVELLIVIVVIGILAAITMVAYTNVQLNARDSVRKQDIARIKKALLLYQIDNGGVQSTPTYGGTGPGGWDSSDRAGWLSFLRSAHGKMPVDPVNETFVSPPAPDAGSGSHRVYYYYCYNTGSGPLPATPNVVLGYRSEKTSTTIRENFAVERCI